MKNYQINTKQEYMTQHQKNKTHQELVKEIWDEADRSFIKAFDEPLDESLKDMYPDAFTTPAVNEKTKKQQ